MSKKLVVIALGGNSIKRLDENGTTEEQLLNVDIAAKQIAGIAKAGWKVVVTHGCGPQVGSLLVQQEESSNMVPPQNLASIRAMCQGQIGWMFQNRLAFHLQNEGMDTAVCSIITQVEVSAGDPNFKDPSKPVGPFYSELEAKELSLKKGWNVKKVKPGVEKSWKRVVSSPEPISIVEEKTIKSLIKKEIIVIASGGGGIPVIREVDGSLTGIDAVIDKDRSGFLLSKTIEADTYMILTDVEHVYKYFNRPDQEYIKTITLNEAQKYMDEGQFLSGSMSPKMEACMRFVEWSGRDAIITSLDNALSALTENSGTRIKA